MAHAAAAAPQVARLVEADVDALALVAAAAYAHAYAELWADPARLSARLHRSGPAALRGWMADPAMRVWVARLAGEIVGFAALRLRSPDPVGADPAAAELTRLYLLPNATRRGVGAALLAAARAAAAAQGASALWLATMAQGPARDAYRAWGFAEVGQTVLDSDIPERAAMIVCRLELTP